MATAPAVGVWLYAPKVVRDYLAGYKDADGNDVPGVLDPTIRVATDVPGARPPVLVLVGTAPTNGGQTRAHSKRRVIIYCYHPSERAAGDLAELVFAQMISAIDIPGNHIYNVEVVGTPARLDDPDDSTPRFVMTLDILLRATFH